jgi:hypothetical protein
LQHPQKNPANLKAFFHFNSTVHPFSISFKS